MISQSAVRSPSSVRTGLPPLAQREPAGASSIDGKTADGAFGHRTVSSTDRSEVSIQIVFSSVYWSCAKTDLSRPPKPDSLKPPNGVVMSPSPKQLTVTVPARISRAAFSAFLRLPV